ncbi:MAG: hypothetical protein GW893_21325 [Armatimonadetes bacterium]|nr:hypothetical protein [Armatimonadota bacterium]PIU66917.1 MAG: hypothetical protein COS85_02845 [Armatimonadetes bacterium CG07_land_8_20_14_0_80_59_28]
MIEETISNIENRVRNAPGMSDDNRAALLSLVAALKTEVSSLSETHGEQAHSIAAFTDLSTHEATRTQKDPALLNHALGGLGHSVREFKVSHPDLVKSVDNICRVLAGIGV